MKSRALVVPAALAVAFVVVQAVPVQSPVQITHDAAAKTYAVSIGGKPFTAYAYGDAFVDKPIFYPVVSPNGARVHREFPMVTAVPGETSDHPHHQSLFFTYDEVNGIHFWNPDKTGRRIVHREARVQGNALVAMLDWKDKEGKVVLEETKRVTFGGGADLFWMDHDITLKAPNVPVIFGDSKEGAFGLRLNDTLKEAGGSGRYLNAEGLESGAVWGKPSAWVAIRGAVKDRGADTDVTVAMFAHPSGVNNPPVLARARLRSLRRQSLRPEGLRPQSTRAGDDAGGGAEPAGARPRRGLRGQSGEGAARPGFRGGREGRALIVSLPTAAVRPDA